MSALIAHDIESTRALLQSRRRGGRIVGVVPTMGALHEGHLELARRARSVCDLAVVTIFVNPTQFGPQDDFARYPRTLDEDLAKLDQVGVDLVFVPRNEDVYPPGFSTFVEPPRIAQPLEGQWRPGHFRGVATVVLKLFQMIPADWAFFGQKDFQQALVIRQMVRDLNLPVAIEVRPTVREADGLAMSSRNQYLSPEERRSATSIYRSLRRGEELLRKGVREAGLIQDAIRGILVEGGFSTDAIDYIALADPESLVEPATVDLPTVLLVAARLGRTRLIDNWFVT